MAPDLLAIPPFPNAWHACKPLQCAKSLRYSVGMAASQRNPQNPRPSANLFPPGLAVRQISPTDNEAVRSLFIESQAGLLPGDADRETRIALKKYTDYCLMSDLARASVHYSKPGRRMWLLESQEHEIVGMIAVDADLDSSDSPGEIALLRRLAVKQEFRRKGVAMLLSRRAEQWASKQGFSKIQLYVSELQPEARDLYSKLEYAEIGVEHYGPIPVHQLEKSLTGSSASQLTDQA